MKSILKKSGWIDILMSIVFMGIGIFMIIKTDSAVKVISYIIGSIFIINGIVRIIDYFVAKGDYDFYNYDFVYGLIAIILGIITITCSNLIGYIFRIMIGSWIIYSGLVRMSLSLKLRKVNISIWSIALILAILMIVTGGYIILEKGVIVLTLGIITVIYSVTDLIESIIFMRYVNKLL